ncbi:MAG: hypothetical protein UX31_C0010G0034 [Candidatus Nomurabacteria bacterium GW2011_GWA1_46_11]|uniref:Uncharacterized protein n=1 Tax=Candidatus Nomurabacteria bacterium GW2011_GWA1_46_11 TaxID=1618732 RepID=A0A0G1QVS0_9BACT|nr:MAG: hypothetical protein UX29_C0008G0004 [Parcubacteria group bacterium GW2011_GWA2_46_10]KKU21903.1 MAG: hypothetical protein UX31_C0010G0034 [Candidatus Nomurabacteria bacterium GW2011_GWA1_46_11]
MFIDGREDGETRVAPVIRGGNHGTAHPDGRKMVETFGQDRTCATRGCNTKLSQYNRDSECSTHSPVVRPSSKDLSSR